MSLLERLRSDLKTAMLGHDAVTVSILRMLLSELKNAQIKKGEDLSEPETIQILRKEMKKREETADLYAQQDQTDRSEQERHEASVIQTYLPAGIKPEVIETFIQNLIKTQNLEQSPAAKGVIMKATMAEFSGQVDGKQVMQLVDKLLQ